MNTDMTDTPIPTDVVLELRADYSVLSQYDPSTFTFPPVRSEEYRPGMWEVVTDIGDATLALSCDPDVDVEDVERAVARFNEDPQASWQPLLNRMFSQARRGLADRRAAIEAAEAAILDFEAGLLR